MVRPGTTVLVILGVLACSSPPAPRAGALPTTPTADVIGVWSLALNAEVTEMRGFTTVDAHFFLCEGRTLRLAAPGEGETSESDAETVADWKALMPRLRDDTAADFLRVGRQSRAIDVARLHTEFPARAAKPEEMNGFLYPTEVSEPGTLGLVRLTDVGFSDDGTQALVFVYSRRVETKEAFECFQLFEKSPSGWDPVGYATCGAALAPLR